MSNPGVILLASLEQMVDFPYRFDIEDNIGEAIHIHYKDIRLDLTIKEFEAFAEEVAKLFTKMIDNDSFDLSYFDENNLVMLAPLLIDLDHIEKAEINLDDIMVDCIEDGKEVYRPLSSSRVIKALNGDFEDDDNRKQENYFDFATHRKMTNAERLEYNLQNIKEKGYPTDDCLISVWGENNHIIDGQHRAGCLYYLNGNMRVPVRKLFFNDKTSNIVCGEKSKNIYEYYEELKTEHYQLEARYHELDIILNERDAIIADYQRQIQELQAKCNQNLISVTKSKIRNVIRKIRYGGQN
ncbi:hypothetical protein [Butyrivibrio fibrisolvens]|uniref:hypothetical protein n=1 Tax=Butyrivibrio fibrisolvens TaxID=831 RepID=UPI0004100749|nr:hypothetical protein [Butyrivibrio fibrisolvens]